MPNPRLENLSLKVRQVIEDYRAGRLVIPEFQREYVWKRSRAPKLIDSLYRRFPISVLLLWRSDHETRPRRRDPRPSRSDTVSWLIDGQQRVITLSRALAGDEGIDVVFNPGLDEFTRANAATAKDPGWYHLSQLLDDEQYRQLRRLLPEGARGEAAEAAFERVRRILDYEIPAVRMLDHSFNDAVTAFTRINTLGVKLKREDIESAKVAATHPGFIADEVSPFLCELRARGFTRLNAMHLFRACGFLARPDGRMRTPLHELDSRTVRSAWTRTKRAVEEALTLVSNEFGLINMDILWSGALLVPVVALCATSNPSERDARGIAGWLAMAALLHRYSKAADTALDQDLRACRRDDPIGALLSNVRRDSEGVGAIASDFNSSLMDKGALFAMYVACRHRGLRDLFAGTPLLHQSSIDRHHLLPRGQFTLRERSTADNIANIAFINGSTNRALSMSGPEVYLAKVDPKILASQCIPTDPSLWRIARAEEFWEARRKLLAESFNDYLQQALPSRKIDFR
jgi:hypothetical protein